MFLRLRGDGERETWKMEHTELLWKTALGETALKGPELPTPSLENSCPGADVGQAGGNLILQASTKSHP